MAIATEGTFQIDDDSFYSKTWAVRLAQSIPGALGSVEADLPIANWRSCGQANISPWFQRPHQLLQRALLQAYGSWYPDFCMGPARLGSQCDEIIREGSYGRDDAGARRCGCFHWG